MPYFDVEIFSSRSGFVSVCASSPDEAQCVTNAMISNGSFESKAFWLDSVHASGNASLSVNTGSMVFTQGYRKLLRSDVNFSPKFFFKVINKCAFLCFKFRNDFPVCEVFGVSEDSDDICGFEIIAKFSVCDMRVCDVIDVYYVQNGSTKELKYIPNEYEQALLEERMDDCVKVITNHSLKYYSYSFYCSLA